jgi:hypothetical protein
MTIRDDRAALSVNPGGAATVRLNGNEFVRFPLAPVIVSLLNAIAAEEAAVRVSVTVLPGAADVGVNAAVTPVGRPSTPNATLPLKSPAPVTPIVVVAVDPTATITEAGVALSVKPAGTAVTAKVNGTVAVRLPLVPVTVTGAAVVAAADADAVSVKLDVPPGANAAGLKEAVTP